MIKIHLSTLCGKHKVFQADVVRGTGIRANTITMYYHEYIKKINVKDLDKLCAFFNCSISDLIEYIPDNQNIEP